MQEGFLMYIKSTSSLYLYQTPDSISKKSITAGGLAKFKDLSKERIV